MDKNSFKYQKEGLAKDLIKLLMIDYKLSIAKAIDILYCSETYKKLCRPETGLYFQSPVYVYSFLKNEIDLGNFQSNQLWRG